MIGLCGPKQTSSKSFMQFRVIWEGNLDLNRNPDHPQNLINFSVARDTCGESFMRIRSLLFKYYKGWTDGQTDRQTKQQDQNKTFLAEVIILLIAALCNLTHLFSDDETP